MSFWRNASLKPGFWRPPNPCADAAVSPTTWWGRSTRIRGAKEWLTARMAEGRHYVETLDQPALTACFDLQQARRAASFDKFFRDISAVLTDLASELPSPS